MFVTLVLRANYDWPFVRRLPLDRALNWTPKNEFLPLPTLIDDVHSVIFHFEDSLSTVPRSDCCALRNRCYAFKGTAA